jgi:lysyl-tRNA synthetase class 2
MLVSFGFIRMSTRLMRSPKVPWWPGSVKTGGVHIHHLVFGIVLLMLAGFLAFAFQPDSPAFEILAVAFGVGAGLTLDEFALWLHLEDVYWAEEGRRSVDAVIVATIIAGALVLGMAPVGEGDSGSVAGILLAAAEALFFATITALKGKYWTALASMFIPIFGWVGAIRLAKPDSPWARRRYQQGSAKLAKATARDERASRRYRRWQELIGGRPTPVESSDEA